MSVFNRMLKIAAVVALLMLVLPAASAQDDGITLVPFTSETFGVTGVIPEGWQEAGPGTYVQPSDGSSLGVLLIQSVAQPVSTIEMLLTSQLQLDALPESTETLETDFAVWQLRTFELEAPPVGAVSVQIALAEIDGVTYIVLLQTLPDTAERLNELVFIPVLESVAKLEAPDMAEYINPDSFTETEHMFGLEGWELPGTLTMPNGDGPFPVAVLVHGSGPNNRDEAIGQSKVFRDIAQGLASQGIAVFRYDKRTLVYGAQINELENFGLDDETTNDALAALDYVRGLDGIDSEKSFVIGHSLGAMTAPRIAEQDGKLAGIILMAGPARNFEDLLYEQIAYQESLAPEMPADSRAVLDGLRKSADGIALLRAGEDASEKLETAGARYYWQSIVDYDQVATAQNLDVPMLILQGGRDYQVTMEDFELWQEALAGKDNVTFISYPDLHHMLFASGDLSQKALPTDQMAPGFADSKLVSDIIDWIKAH